MNTNTTSSIYKSHDDYDNIKGHLTALRPIAGEALTSRPTSSLPQLGCIMQHRGIQTAQYVIYWINKFNNSSLRSSPKQWKCMFLILMSNRYSDTLFRQILNPCVTNFALLHQYSMCICNWCWLYEPALYSKYRSHPPLHLLVHQVIYYFSHLLVSLNS